MQTPLRQLLAQYREHSQTEREKGTYFERLAIVFMQRDPGMVQEYEDCWDFATWARLQGLPAGDTGIDAVAKIRGEDSFCAIQCKFYREGSTIPKSELDKFLATMGASRHFSRGLIIETTGRPISANASDLFPALSITVTGLDRLEESPIDWSAFLINGEIRLEPPKELRPHQVDALDAVRKGLTKADRGKLIMACGTGKTFTGLKIAEDLVGAGGNVLVLLPSLALVNQTIREWTIDSQTPLRSFAVCSDSQVGKRRGAGGSDDVAEIDVHDLDYPATTNAARLASKAAHDASDRMTVVFSTYQSIQVISDAQLLNGFPEFDLIICDEAHRTTGATLAGEDESNFVKVHDQAFIQGRKRIYMTATPRVFGEAVKSKASEASAALASMDDEALFGKDLFVRGFGWAVENELLTDYKVIVLAVDEAMVSASVQKRLMDQDSSLVLDDATKIIGCYKALIKSGLADEVLTDRQPMQRALAFAKDIKSSKLIQSEFRAVIEEYRASDEGQEALGDTNPLTVELQHVDGTMGARERAQKLDWLKESHGDAVCRILTNARCLSEGVDVPALDAILFMHPRKSQIDVVQSVGRVMRRAPGKNMGYVILPIGVPAGMTPEEALADNERYRVVWQILNALRSHDERFEGRLNQADLGEDISDKVQIIPVSHRIEVTAEVKDLPSRTMAKSTGLGLGEGSAAGDGEGSDGDSKTKAASPFQGAFVFDEFSKAIMAKIVKKCGQRDYWENWAGDIAKIAQTHISRITGLVANPESPEREAFDGFLAEIRDDLNDSISEGEAIEMLAQHLITRPVFDALFEGYSFARNNPVSKAMEAVLSALDEHRLDREAESLDRFYASVKRRAAGVQTAEAKQRIIVELYDKFFRNAFPKMTERLGIVYTPVEVVDFIIHSVNEVLQSEFGQTLGSKGVHILDPFTGTGTFITRLLQSGLIERDQLEHKYRNEIHANEIVLLAYYIAAINIEAVYHGLSGGDYVPFDGICLTDTFQLYEQDKDLLATLMPDNSHRRTRQKELDIRVILGNPPYSVGQDSDNSEAANLSYPLLDKRIQSTYVAQSTGNPRSLYDSYVRAIRWASDRIGDAGVIAFVSNAGWLEGKAADGLRQCLAEEYASIYVFHLRGNQRTAGERSRKEGGKIFGSGSRTPVAITLLVKNPDATDHGRIQLHDIGEYLTREEKLERISRFGSIGGIERSGGWQSITPDEHSDWLGQRNKDFDRFPALGAKRDGASLTIFENYSAGVKTNRDSWAYGSSKSTVTANMKQMVDFYVDCLSDPHRADINDPAKISWSWVLRERFGKGKGAPFREESVVKSLYRPFSFQWLYYDGFYNENRYQMPKIFPKGTEIERVICIEGMSARGFSAIMSSCVPDIQVTFNSQCFPRFIYDEATQPRDGELALGEASEGGPVRRDAITDAGLAHFQAAYPGEAIAKDDLFYYVYGLLHSPEYRERFADNLSKQLPRIPAVKKAADFWAFVEAGRKLGDLHCDFDNAEPYNVTIAEGDLRLASIPDPERYFRVEKMKFAGKRPNVDKTTVIYNSNITITNIPLEAYDYVVNGKAALDWVMERQCVKVDKASGIVNDANRYAIETMGDPAYPLKLFQRVITISLETMAIVGALPKLEID
jgi:predicted helicase